MLKTVSLLFLLILNFAYAQYVPNAGFHVVGACPSLFGGLTITGWHERTATPDNYHTCGTPGLSGSPYNFFGYQSGNYSGLYVNGANYEALSCELLAGISSGAVVEVFTRYCQPEASKLSCGFYVVIGQDSAYFPATTDTANWTTAIDTILLTASADTLTITGTTGNLCNAVGWGGINTGYLFIDSVDIEVLSPLAIGGRRQILTPEDEQPQGIIIVYGGFKFTVKNHKLTLVR